MVQWPFVGQLIAMFYKHLYYVCSFFPVPEYKCVCGIPTSQVNPIKTNSLKKKELSKSDIPAAVTADAEYQESNSGSYSTTTTLSINKNELVGGKLLSLPPAIR